MKLMKIEINGKTYAMGIGPEVIKEYGKLERLASNFRIYGVLGNDALKETIRMIACLINAGSDYALMTGAGEQYDRITEEDLTDAMDMKDFERVLYAMSDYLCSFSKKPYFVQ